MAQGCTEVGHPYIIFVAAAAVGLVGGYAGGVAAGVVAVAAIVIAFFI